MRFARAMCALRGDVVCDPRGTPRIILSPTPEGKQLLARAMPRISLFESPTDTVCGGLKPKMTS